MGMHYKTLRLCNLWEIDKFRSKLEYSGLDKRINVNKKHTLAYYEVRT
jgi:hypothetical protein